MAVIGDTQDFLHLLDGGIELLPEAGAVANGKHFHSITQALADELKLAVPLMPWHAQRDGFVEFAGWLSLVTGSLGKMAQDIILMAQTEVGEVGESAEQGRGGSSTMPQKSNPITSELIVAAARTNASLLSAMHNAQIQEQGLPVRLAAPHAPLFPVRFQQQRVY